MVDSNGGDGTGGVVALRVGGLAADVQRPSGERVTVAAGAPKRPKATPSCALSDDCLSCPPPLSISLCSPLFIFRLLHFNGLAKLLSDIEISARFESFIGPLSFAAAGKLSEVIYSLGWALPQWRVKKPPFATFFTHSVQIKPASACIVLLVHTASTT